MKRIHRIKRPYWIFFLLLSVIILACHVTKIDVRLFFERKSQLTVLLSSMFPPDFSYQTAIYPLLFLTISMSIVGTFLGTAAAFLLSVILSKRLHPKRRLIFLLRSILTCLRGIPVLILALLSTFLFGIGSFSGTFAIFLYTMAIMTRIGYEDLDSVDYSSYDALCASGIRGSKAFVRTILLSFLPGYLANALYLLEANIRQATILGYVGAGGIGLLLHEKIAWREYAKVGMILCLLYLVVLALEGMSMLMIRLLHREDHFGRLSKGMITIGCVILFMDSIPTIALPKFSASGQRILKAMGHGLIHPDLTMFFDFTSNGVFMLLLETICIAVLGTLLGTVIAFVLSIAASTRLFPIPVTLAVRALLSAIRTIPILIYGFMFIRVVGPGSFAGVLTLGIASVGLLSKRFIVAIEGMDLSPVEAMKSMGCPRRCYLVRVVIPLLSGQLLSAISYRFDVNLREASILGIVGAGGIGAPLVFAINNYQWSQVSSLLLGLLFVLILIDYLSARFREITL